MDNGGDKGGEKGGDKGGDKNAANGKDADKGGDNKGDKNGASDVKGNAGGDKIKNAAVAPVPTLAPTVAVVGNDGRTAATDRTNDSGGQDGLFLIGGDHCGDLTPELRAGGLFRKVVQFSDPDSFTHAESSQFLAFQWMMNDDERKLCPSDTDIEVDQRYIMSVLYFAMYGDLWPSCNRARAGFQSDCESDSQRFLSGESVCQWRGVICNDEGHVVKISVCKFTVIISPDRTLLPDSI